MRVYYQLDKTDPVMTELCDLACNNDNIDLCTVDDLPGTPVRDASKMFGMIWKFFPTLDPQVTRVINERTRRFYYYYLAGNQLYTWYTHRSGCWCCPKKAIFT